MMLFYKCEIVLGKLQLPQKDGSIKLIYAMESVKGSLIL